MEGWYNFGWSLTRSGSCVSSNYFGLRKIGGLRFAKTLLDQRYIAWLSRVEKE
jgi:hypothetical protein